MISANLILGMLNLLVAFAEAAIGLRVLLKLMGASTSAPFVGWVYDTSTPLVAPFQGMFPSPTFTGPFTIEFSAIFAVFAYMFLGYVIQEAVGIFNHGFFKETHQKRKSREEYRQVE